jgi:hypothetical protein
MSVVVCECLILGWMTPPPPDKDDTSFYSVMIDCFDRMERSRPYED